jgi:hypothetical protein
LAIASVRSCIRVNANFESPTLLVFAHSLSLTNCVHSERFVHQTETEVDSLLMLVLYPASGAVGCTECYRMCTANHGNAQSCPWSRFGRAAQRISGVSLPEIVSEENDNDQPTPATAAAPAAASSAKPKAKSKAGKTPAKLAQEHAALEAAALSRAVDQVKTLTPKPVHSNHADVMTAAQQVHVLRVSLCRDRGVGRRLRMRLYFAVAQICAGVSPAEAVAGIKERQRLSKANGGGKSTAAHDVTALLGDVMAQMAATQAASQQQAAATQQHSALLMQLIAQLVAERPGRANAPAPLPLPPLPPQPLPIPNPAQAPAMSANPSSATCSVNVLYGNAKP